jgi:carbonic anhydrase
VILPGASSTSKRTRGALSVRTVEGLRDETFQNKDLGVDASGRDFLPFTDLEQSVRDDVQRIRDCELIPVTGTIYDVRTGEVQEVVRG